MRPVVACEPDLVHAVVEADDAFLRHDLPHVVDDALRRQGKAALLRPVGDLRKNPAAQRQERAGIRYPPLEPVGQQLEARADIADKLRVREEHFLHGRRQISHMEHGRSLRAHDERGLLHRVVTDGDDEIGAAHHRLFEGPAREDSKGEGMWIRHRTLGLVRRQHRGGQGLHEGPQPLAVLSPALEARQDDGPPGSPDHVRRAVELGHAGR